MTQKTPRELIAEVSEGDLTPLGTRKAQSDDGAIYVCWPQPFASNQGLEQSTEIEVYRHDPTGAMVFMPPNNE